MFTKEEKTALKAAVSFILRELEVEGVARVNGFGEFSIKDFTYRDPITKKIEKTKTVKFKPFTAAKRVAKAGLPKPKKAIARKAPPKKVSAPVKKKKTEPQKFTPGETYTEVPKKKPAEEQAPVVETKQEKPVKKKPARFRLGRKIRTGG